jgi:hypothetical protein
MSLIRAVLQAEHPSAAVTRKRQEILLTTTWMGAMCANAHQVGLTAVRHGASFASNEATLSIHPRADESNWT